MIRYVEFDNFFSPRLGLIRTLLAFGNLFTLLLNPIAELFPHEQWTARLASRENILDKINMFFLFDYNHLYVPYILSILILLMVVVGYFPQITSILHCWVAYSILHALVIVEGGDQITYNLTFLLIPLCLFDRRINHWHKQVTFNYHLNKYLDYFLFTILCFIQIQVALLYLDAGIEKCKGAEWLDGSGIYYWSTDTVFGASGIIASILFWIFKSGILTFFFTWGVIALEITLFASLFMTSKQRKHLFLLGVFFHIMIILVHGLFSFGLAMIAALILLLRPIPNPKPTFEN